MTQHWVTGIVYVFLLIVNVRPSPIGGINESAASATGNAEENGGDDDSGSFLNQWAVHILGGPRVADQVAADIGFESLGQVSLLVSSEQYS